MLIAYLTVKCVNTGLEGRKSNIHILLNTYTYIYNNILLERGLL